MMRSRAQRSPARREEPCRIPVERVVVRDRGVESIDWTPSVHRSSKKSGSAPKGAVGTHPLSDHDSLAWYAA
jgi:hypothetical protein